MAAPVEAVNRAVRTLEVLADPAIQRALRTATTPPLERVRRAQLDARGDARIVMG